MAIGIKIDISKTDINRIEKGLHRIINNTGEVIRPLGDLIVQELQKELMSRKEGSPKTHSAKQIYARRKNKNTVNIIMPKKLIYYDSMNPHFVSLKRGRNITKWASKYYGTKRTSSRSMVRRGPRGGITGGFMWVTPHPFVSMTLNRVRARFPTILKGIIKKTYRGVSI